MKPLEAALLAGGLAAFAGGVTGVLALAGAVGLEPRAPDAAFPSREYRLSLGAFLLASHAVVAVGLWRMPTVGACMAASLGAGWMAAAAAAFVAMLASQDRLTRRAFAIACRAAIGFALMSPLWAYLQLIRLHVLSGVTA
jgi:hypothetical protein